MERKYRVVHAITRGSESLAFVRTPKGELMVDTKGMPEVMSRESAESLAAACNDCVDRRAQRVQEHEREMAEMIREQDLADARGMAVEEAILFEKLGEQYGAVAFGGEGR